MRLSEQGLDTCNETLEAVASLERGHAGPTPSSTEWDAKDYHGQSRLQEVLAEEHLGWLPLEGWERVLDVGCGDGKVTSGVAARLLPRGSVVGIDPGRDMIAFARSRYGPTRCPNLRFEVADARGLPFSAEFDRVVSFNALHWVPEAEAALRSIRRALRPGGLAPLECVPGAGAGRAERVTEEVRHRPRWAGWFSGFRDPFAHLDAAGYGALAGRAGLEVVRVETQERSWDFGSREAFLGFLRTTSFAWTGRLPPGRRGPFLEEVLGRYQELNGPGNVFRFYQMGAVLRAAPGAGTSQGPRRSTRPCAVWN